MATATRRKPLKVFFEQLQEIEEWLTTPARKNLTPEIISQSRLLAGMLLVLIGLGLIVEIPTIQSDRYQDAAGIWIFFVALGILVAAFFINRAGHFYVAAWIAVLVQSIVIFLLTFITGDMAVDVDFLNFLILPILFTSVFFSDKIILVVVGLFLGGCLSSVLIPGIDVVQVMLGPGSFLTVCGGVIFLVFRHRNLLEADRKRELVEKEELYRNLFEAANDAIFLIGLDNVHISANQKAADMLGYTVQDLVGMPISEVISPQEYTDALKVRNAILNGTPVPLYERVFCKKGGKEFPVEINAILVRDRHGNPAFIQSIVRDITERKQVQLRLQRQLEQLKALREIDHMISSSLDLQLILENILTYVTTESRGCAANILLLDERRSLLECYASRGFREGPFTCEPAGLDDCMAGQAAAHARPVRVIFSKELMTDCSRYEGLVDQGFKVGFAVPLIAKGTVKGVLEVFLRGPIEPSPEWFNFLETLSSEAAIAVDSAELFKNLQLSNIDLVRSYDATLEGWVRALELRDEETQGHSQRVTEMTVDLGRALGVAEGELVHMRRGALLHDIGKMGIPDAILHKPGPLTPEEWVIMKKHPVYALEMLSFIPFLQPVLDIPYAHHERWDGSGYPLGLKGSAIPQAARIFAVVDVWDALKSDRPYRPAWSTERALAYIQEQSGKEFDPLVVKTFTSLVSNFK